MSSATGLQPRGSLSSTDNHDSVLLNPAIGTTHLGIVIKNAIIIASYSHEKHETSTLVQIDKRTICTKVGEPVDRLFLAQCRLWKTQNNRSLPIKLAAKLLEEMINFYSVKGFVLSTEAFIAGWEGECPLLYHVDTTDDGWGCVSTQRYLVGPGASFVYHTSGKYKFEMSIDEAVSYSRWAMHLASYKVSNFYFGNRGPSVYYGGLYGWKKLLGDNVMEFPNVDIEDEETSKYWHARLKWIKEHCFMTDAFCWLLIENSKPHCI